MIQTEMETSLFMVTFLRGEGEAAEGAEGPSSFKEGAFEGERRWRR